MERINREGVVEEITRITGYFSKASQCIRGMAINGKTGCRRTYPIKPCPAAACL